MADNIGLDSLNRCKDKLAVIHYFRITHDSPYYFTSGKVLGYRDITK